MATDLHEPEELTRWLASRGAAGIPHPGGTLLAHLERVHALLAEWGGATRDRARRVVPRLLRHRRLRHRAR